MGTETVAEQQILVKCCKSRHFGVISKFGYGPRSEKEVKK